MDKYWGTVFLIIGFMYLGALFTYLFFKGRPMKTIREIQDEIDVQTVKINIGKNLLDAALNEVAFGLAMEAIHDAACEIGQLHEELYPHKDRLRILAELDEEDECDDPHPGYRVGQ